MYIYKCSCCVIWYELTRRYEKSNWLFAIAYYVWDSTAWQRPLCIYSGWLIRFRFLWSRRSMQTKTALSHSRSWVIGARVRSILSNLWACLIPSCDFSTPFFYSTYTCIYVESADFYKPFEFASNKWACSCWKQLLHYVVLPLSPRSFARPRSILRSSIFLII